MASQLRDQAVDLGSVTINRADPHLVEPGGEFGTRKLYATRILSVPVSLVDMQTAVRTILEWAGAGESGTVCVRDVHGIMRCEEDPALRDVHERASMVTPDGMPLALVSRWRGHRTSRVPGPSLVEAVFEASRNTGIRHYLYGGKQGVAEKMAANLMARYPGVEIVGTVSPPFGQASPDEDERDVEAIRQARPHLVWVGMSSPKQDFWIDEHAGRLPGMVLLAVGAAFDFHSGAIKRAPVWMQNSGLEWLHRLSSEPRRLWRRYLVLAPRFVWHLLTKERPA